MHRSESNRGISIHGLPSATKIKEDSLFEGVPDWINRQLKTDEENERSLQEKIIQLYELIEKKTVKNIEIKKNNEILKAQVDTYLSIIQKIQRAVHSSNNSNNQLSNFNTEHNYQKQIQNQQNSQQQIYYVHQNKQQYPVFTNQTFHIERNSQPAQFHNIYSKGHEQPEIDKQHRVSCLQSSEDSENMENSTEIYQRTQKAKMVPLFVSVPSTSRSPKVSPLMLSPRPSIDHVTPTKLANPNKSFLKKVGHSHNSSTGNLGTKIGTISIQSLWNDTKIYGNNNRNNQEKYRQKQSKNYGYKN